MSISMTEITTRAHSGSEKARLWVMSRSRAEYGFEIGLLASLYYGSARLGYALHFSGPVAAIVWLPVGVGISYLYLRGPRFWPGVLVGDLLANDYGALPVGSALGQTAGNILEVVVAAMFLRYLSRRTSLLDSVGGVAWMLVPLAGATTVSATIGSLSLHLGGVIEAKSFATVWRTWWLGDACGALIVVPLALAWARPLPRITLPRYLEGAAMLATAAALSDVGSSSPHALAYLAFPALIWAALRFGRRGATLCVFVVSAFAVWNTTRRVGPFHYHSITGSVLSVQLFITVSAITALCVAAIVAEREKFAERLGESRAQVLRVADAERQRIERNLHDGAQQRLLALAVHLRLAAERARRTPEAAAGLIENAEAELQVAFDELRDLSHGIHPTVLTNLGLATAIRSVAARSVQPVSLLELPTVRVDTEAEAVAYFVFVEALANAQKHSSASAITVRATVSTRGLEILVSDNGVGGALEPMGGGLKGLRARVEDAGGTLSVDSIRGRGTRIRALIPLAAQTA
jgi:signal transduction histidine kinase